MKRQWLVLVALGSSLVLAACSDGSGSGSSGGPLGITEMIPAAEETDVIPSMVMVTRFNQTVDPDTLEDAFALLDEHGDRVEGSLEWLPGRNQAHFYPAGALDLGAEYRLSWSDALRDADGNALQSPEQGRFTVRSGQWHDWETLVGPYYMSDMPSTPSHLITSVGPQGDALIGWFQRDDEQSALMASHYRPGDGWRHPQVLSTPWVMRADALSLTWLDDYQALAVWHEGHGRSHQVMAARFHYQTGWAEPEQLGLGSRALEPRVIARPDGTAIVHWLYQDQVHVTSLQGGHWAYPAQISTGQGHSIDAHELLITADDTRVLIWEEEDSRGKQVYQAAVDEDNSLQGDPARVLADTADVQLVAAFVDGDDWLVVWSVDDGSALGRRPQGQWFNGQEPLADPFWVTTSSGVSGRLDRDAVTFFVSPEGYRDLYLNNIRHRVRTDQQGDLVHRDSIPWPHGDNDYVLAQWVQGADGQPIGLWRYRPRAQDDDPHSVLVARHSDSQGLPVEDELLNYALPGLSPRVPDLYFFTGAQGHAAMLEYGIIDDLQARIRTRMFD
ncbi:hypothetical protein E4656_07100 [Natronospirillum operosum]|uniref:SbsA Ig-like domain-containing protein n=1 Tax=Natronospirillum operosum TaxID=2759953 RepID=A0A4Z0WF74_9GAMM|nr:Ig-like domain-containing protein [Natronospirillum operosum]TGG93946.1 hypothetical protein E4656_07100 [Natronospirillum operosum]